MPPLARIGWDDISPETQDHMIASGFTPWDLDIPPDDIHISMRDVSQFECSYSRRNGCRKIVNRLMRQLTNRRVSCPAH
jgi:hypothetical protein